MAFILPRCTFPSFPFSKGLFVSTLCLIGVVVDSAIQTISNDGTEKASEATLKEAETTQRRPPKNITSYNMDTIDSLMIVEEHIQNEDYTEAEQKLADIWTNEAELTLSEKADLIYMSSRISLMQQNMEATIGHLEKVLEYRDNITYAREEEVLLRLAKLYLAEKEHVKAHGRLNEWLEIVEQPKANELAFAGSLFVAITSYARAKKYLKRAIDQQEANGLEVDAQWFELLDYVEKRLDTEI
ncbi:MAG: hypothetical protein F4W92_07305 [Gammaproteobacteria bacterium]|nr:hypothetical protein [Gammaproteobacteria bacterium]